MTVLGHGRRAYSMWTGTQQVYKQAWLAAKCFQDPDPVPELSRLADSPARATMCWLWEMAGV